ncbi:MAG: TonB-dependent receptor plug domain-containing protein [Candidatus Poribacteria bacterium]|nr:TonB-dependent receptor plug domain-containing protein [Candidatus Poribacteria bacterium]
MKHILILLMFLMSFAAFPQDDDPIQDEPLEDIITLPPVEVKTERIEKKPKYSFKGPSIRNSVGSGGDPLRALDQLPSVGVLNDFLGILSVRGGDREDNLYYFDRLPLGYPYHLYGIVSTVNAEVIENIEVYPGGYGAEFGSDSQAVIDIYSRNITDTRFGSKFNLNPVYSQAFLEGNIGKRGYWYVFGRRSFMGPLFELLTRLVKVEDDLVTQVPRFWSYQGKYVYQLTKSHRLVVNAIGAGDSSEFRLGPNEVSYSDLRGLMKSENPFDSQGIHLYSEKEKSFKSIVSLTRSFSRRTLQYGEGYSYGNTDSVFSLRGDLQYWLKFPKTLIESGFDLSYLPSSITSIGARPPEEGDWDFDFRLKAQGEKISTFTSKTLHRLEGYLQATQDLVSSRYAALYATVGMRANYFNLIDSFSLQPRGLLGVTLGPEQPNTVGFSLLPVDLRLIYGNYVQNPRLYQVVLGNENPEIATSLARHYVVALEKRLTAETKIEVAGYYKNLSDMITFNLLEKRYQNQKSGYVKGIEVSLEHEIGEAFRGWLAYSYTVSKRQDSPHEKERDFMFGTPHVFAINLNYALESWEFGAKWQYKSGVLYTTLVDREMYTNPFTKKQTWLPIWGVQKRAAPYHRLDLRVHCSFIRLEKAKAGVTFELWNAYNRRNILQVRYSEHFEKEVQIAQLPIIPFIALTLEF